MTRFDKAKRAALMRDLVAFVLRRPADLLPFDEARERLRLKRVVDRGVREVPLDLIVGTLGREREFNRAFLPRLESLRERWDDIKDLAEGAKGFPPVELYQVGDVYFVVDGHHRVSVAHSMKAPSVEAHVREFLTPLPIDSGMSVADLIQKEGLAELLEQTGLVPSEPDELTTTEPGGSVRLLEHISVHRYFKGMELQREVSILEAAHSWRETVYLPVVAKIRASGVMSDFPGRTVTDLYLFTMDHLHYLRQEYAGADVSAADAVAGFKAANRKRKRGSGRVR